ncbi:hypothetical protein GCM10007160_37210 [Litchfieldella qijiaojingensis]|uniref:Cytochrome c domain-containing protein n=1 Tax=Litchfieldella qijiaojingensis TaxID=980347 RepID=A0ABQ2ZA39_9GAMM|nr:cytochrome c [Halomonas qijiaojingensis]GGY06163.1 hypothetical protein GCM10007160_37210 [Halomonas qijiaojingensis]
MTEIQIPRWLVAAGATGMLLLATGMMTQVQASAEPEKQEQVEEGEQASQQQEDVKEAAATESTPGDYTIIDGKVDQGTYDGYIAFTRNCMACHGPDGVGSTFAPSLVKAAERRSFAEFARTIAGGRDIQPGRVMPSFADDQYVLSNIENIYSYMKARAAGDLGRGRPKVIEEEEEEEASEGSDED